MFWRGLVKTSHRVYLGLVIVVFASTWVIPTLIGDVDARSDSAGAVFGLGSQTWGGPWLAALGLGGIWNREATLVSGGFPWVPLVGVVLLILAVVGFRSARRSIDRTAVNWLAVIAFAGLVVALVGAALADSHLWHTMLEQVPGAGLLRDGQKLLAPLALLYAVCVPFGMVTICRKLSGVPRVETSTLVASVVVVLLLMPDALGGAWGKLAPVAYPRDWNAVRAAIGTDPALAAVALPWSAYRRYRWNDDRSVIDPAPLYFPTTVIGDDRLPVIRGGQLQFVAGDNPRSEQVRRALETDQPLAATMPPLGIGWVIEQLDQPGELTADDFVGLELVVDSASLRLWRVATPVVNQSPTVPIVVWLANFGSLAVFLLTVVWLVCGRIRVGSRCNSS